MKDFIEKLKENACTSNNVPVQNQLTTNTLMDAVKMLRTSGVLDRRIDKVYATCEYINMLKTLPVEHMNHMQQHPELWGLPIYLDDGLPEGILARFVDTNGEVLGEIKK